MVLPANVRVDRKVIARTNTLAYLASSSAMKEKIFITLTPSVHFIKLFYLLQIMRPNKLEGLSLETLSSQVFEFEFAGVTRRPLSRRQTNWLTVSTGRQG